MRAMFDFYYFFPKSIRSELKIIAPFVSDYLIAMAVTWCAGCLIVQHISPSSPCVLVCSGKNDSIISTTSPGPLGLCYNWQPSWLQRAWCAAMYRAMSSCLP